MHVKHIDKTHHFTSYYRMRSTRKFVWYPKKWMADRNQIKISNIQAGKSYGPFTQMTRQSKFLWSKNHRQVSHTSMEDFLNFPNVMKYHLFSWCMLKMFPKQFLVTLHRSATEQKIFSLELLDQGNCDGKDQNWEKPLEISISSNSSYDSS